jgi:hypothetical protein
MPAPNDWTTLLADRTARVRRIYGFVRAEIRDFVPLSLRGRLRAWRSGFTSKSYVLYGLDRNDPGQYLPDFVDGEYLRTNPEASGLNDKLHFSRVLAGLGIRHARVFGYLDRGRFHPSDNGVGTQSIAVALPHLLAREKRLVLKPSLGHSGRGINFLSVRDGEYTLNEAPETFDRLVSIASALERYLVLEHVQQAPYAARLFPGTTNTLRVLTVRDPVEHQPFVAAASQRIGTSATTPIDNFHAGRGGICADIDLETGILGAALTLTPSGARNSLDRHPETGAQIAGVQVPDWPATRDLVVHVAAQFPEAPVVGWDIVPTADGPAWLEANVPPGTAVWQVHRPLLRDGRVRRFYENLGWI